MAQGWDQEPGFYRGAAAAPLGKLESVRRRRKGACVCVFFSNTPFPRKVSCAPQHERSMLASFTEDFLKETSQEQAAMATKTPMEKGCKMQICRCQPLQNASETLYSVL